MVGSDGHVPSRMCRTRSLVTGILQKVGIVEYEQRKGSPEKRQVLIYQRETGPTS